MFRAIRLLVCLFVLVLPAWPQAVAQEPPEQAAPDEAADNGNQEVAPDSPRASLAAYLDLCREGRYKEAAGYLDLPSRLSGERARTARRLKAVLDRHLWFDLDLISPLGTGDVDDGLPPGRDRVGTIPGSTGKPEPVILVRQEEGEEARWVFSTSTVVRVEDWFSGLGNSWLLDLLPEPLLKPGPRNLLWWQWLALPILGVIAWIAGRILNLITRTILARLALRTESEWDDVIIQRIKSPLTVAWTIIVLQLLIPLLELYEPAERFLRQINRGGLFLVFFWALLRTIDVVGQLVRTSRWATRRPETTALVPLATRVSKVLVGVIAVIAVISQLGYPVASLLAGLGLGGLAFALAAQKTVENLFGSVSIGVDQPIREGDFVKVGDFLGTVEQIGLRSTRFRTLDRSVITIPNGRLADMQLETFALRDRIRLTATLGVVYGTTSAQMKLILAGLEQAMREHPRIWPDMIVARFTSFGDFSLNIEIMCWFMTTDFNEFRQFREEILLSFMEVVEKAGSEFAFPTRTVHVVNAGPGDAGGFVSGTD